MFTFTAKNTQNKAKSGQLTTLFLLFFTVNSVILNIIYRYEYMKKGELL